MATKKATTTDDFTSDSPVQVAGEGQTLAGPPAEGDTPTRAVGDPAPDTANLTGSEPAKPTDKPVKMKSPWGSDVTVSSDIAHHFK